MKNYDLGAVIDTLYGFEENIRIQNLPGKGFYGCFANNQISFRGIHSADFEAPQAIPLFPKVNYTAGTWYASGTLNILCTFLFEAIAKNDRRMIAAVKKHNRSALEQVLYAAHGLGFSFIIESAWDLGYEVYLKLPGTEYKVETLNSYRADEIGYWISQKIGIAPLINGMNSDSNDPLTTPMLLNTEGQGKTVVNKI